MEFKCKVAVVTGGGAGLGNALSQRLSQLGASVIVVDRNAAAARETVELIRSKGGKAEFHILDVSNWKQVDLMFQAVLTQFQIIHFVFNNAGMALAGEIKYLEVEHWRPIFDSNLFGVIHGSQAAYRIMARQGFGHIINISSSIGLMPAPFFSHYSASKYAVVGFTQALHAETLDQGIRVHLVCPGYIESGLIKSGFSMGMSGIKVRKMVHFRTMSPEDAAQRILHGLTKRKMLIVFPWYCHLFIWFQRVFPLLAERLNRYSIQKFRSETEYDQDNHIIPYKGEPQR